MAVTKKIEIDGKEVGFKASAAVPRLYRNKFGRDVYKDLMALNDAIKENTEEASMLDTFSLEMFESLAWVMAKHYDPEGVPDSVDDFLEQFNTFSIYQVLPELIDLWGMNIKTTVPARKKLRKTERPMTTALFMLRCVQLGLNIADLDLLTIGLVNEMFNESGRDGIEWREEASQSDMDRV